MVSAILEGKAQPDLHLIQADIVSSALDEDLEMHLFTFLPLLPSFYFKSSSSLTPQGFLSRPLPARLHGALSQNPHSIGSLHASLASHPLQIAARPPPTLSLLQSPRAPSRRLGPSQSLQLRALLLPGDALQPHTHPDSR